MTKEQEAVDGCVSVEPTLLLTDRLRGKYVIPVNDGAGPLYGSMTFTRQFETPPIQHQAADLIDTMLAALTGLLAVAEMTTFSDQYPAECEAARAAINLATQPGEEQ